MSTQEDFWAGLGQGKGQSDNDAPLPPIMHFSSMNTPIQGTVEDTYQTTEKGFNGAPDPVGRDGKPRPMMVLTLRLASDYTGVNKQTGPFTIKAGELGRVFLKTDLLWKTAEAMAEAGLSALPKGALWGAAWVSQEQLERGTAKRHKVQIKV
jgi:hypothetical protein